MEQDKEQADISVESGDALVTDPTKKTIIAHVVNNRGLWGAGFVLAISKKWKEPARMYKNLCKKIDADILAAGTAQFIDVENNITVCNMFAMKGVAGPDNPQPLSYNSLMTCLRALRLKAERDGYEVIQMPKIGAGLARGNWKTIKKLINLVFRKSAVKIIIKTL